MRSWIVQKEDSYPDTDVKWRRITKHPAYLGSALQNGMRHQLRDYLSHYRLLHLESQVTIPLHELLKFEIREFCSKRVYAC